MTVSSVGAVAVLTGLNLGSKLSIQSSVAQIDFLDFGFDLGFGDAHVIAQDFCKSHRGQRRPFDGLFEG